MLFIIRLLLFVVPLVLSPAFISAQKTNPSDNTKKPKFRNPKPITTFAFIQLYGGVIIIKAALDNHSDSLQFILDTGSGGISLDSLTAQEMNVPTLPSGRTIRGIAGIKQVKFAYNHSLKLPGLSIDSLDFHINDYEMLSGVYGLKVDGIIGYSFFKKYIVVINFDRHEIEIYPPDNFDYPSSGYTLRPAIASLPMQYAEVTDLRTISSRYFLDTGAGLCLLLSKKFISDSVLFQQNRKMYPSVAEGIGGKKEMWVTIVKKFRIGRYVFKKMPVYVFDDDYNVTSYPFLSGLIGNDLLRRFNMVINYGKSEFHLTPNQAFREGFDYAYTGFNMFQDGFDVIAVDVIPGSPAAKAGLLENDLIVSVGNKFGGNLQDYKTILQQPGNKIKIVVSRNGNLEELKISTGSILK